MTGVSHSQHVRSFPISHLVCKPRCLAVQATQYQVLHSPFRRPQIAEAISPNNVGDLFVILRNDSVAWKISFIAFLCNKGMEFHCIFSGMTTGKAPFNTYKKCRRKPLWASMNDLSNTRNKVKGQRLKGK